MTRYASRETRNIDRFKDRRVIAGRDGESDAVGVGEGVECHPQPRQAVTDLDPTRFPPHLLRSQSAFLKTTLSAEYVVNRE